MAVQARAHWERIYEQKEPEEVTWFEALPETSLELIEQAGIGKEAPIIDGGGGSSRLAGALLAAGYTDVTVADISGAALERAREELGEAGGGINWVQADLREHDFGRAFALWHDRAVFHFMVEPADRDRYLRTLRGALQPGGHLVLAGFGPEAPPTCSGLPVRRYRPDEVRELLPDFELVSSRFQLHNTPSGNRQQFFYAHLVRSGEGSTGSPSARHD